MKSVVYGTFHVLLIIFYLIVEKKVGEIDFATPISCFWGYSLFKSLDGICEYS